MPLVASSDHPGGASEFTYSEFSGWQHATRAQLDALDDLVGDVLEPARRALGVPFTITSWIDGAHAATSVHPLGAAVDVVAGGSIAWTWALFVWFAQNAQFGELIFEQPIAPGVTGHVHATLPGYGGSQQVLYQRADGGLLALDPFLVGRIFAHV